MAVAQFENNDYSVGCLAYALDTVGYIVRCFV